MKRIFKLALIVFIFFISLTANAADIHTPLPQAASFVQTFDSNDAVYNSASKVEKFIVPSNGTNEFIVIQKNNSDLNKSFTGFKNNICPSDSQFAQLLSYIYNKTYLQEKNLLISRIYHTEISPNAP
ncbi:hypothetical protein HDR58_05875 [bacterium]|nr:hypothetical protein [bacterium]